MSDGFYRWDMVKITFCLSTRTTLGKMAWLDCGHQQCHLSERRGKRSKESKLANNGIIFLFAKNKSVATLKSSESH